MASVKGIPLKFAKYPLGFAPVTGYSPLVTECALFGAGESTTYRESFALTNGVEFYLTNTYTGASNCYGLQVNMNATGTSTACKYATSAFGILTSGAVAEMWGSYIVGQLSGGTASGQFGGATIEAYVDSGVSNAPATQVLQLASIINGNVSSVASFINLRDYGSNAMPQLFLLGDTSATPGAQSTIYSPAGFRCKINTSTLDPVFIPVSKGLPSTTAYYGRGSSSTAEAMGTAYTEGLGLFLSSAKTSTTVVGGRIEVSKTGTAANAVGIQGKASGTAGNGTNLIGIYGIAQNSGTGERPVVTGYYVGGEFEVIVDDTVTITDANAAICLDVGNNAASSPGDPTYIFLNNWGSNKANYLFRTLGDEAVGTTSDAVLMSTTHAAHAQSHGIKIQVNGTDYWIMVTDQKCSS